MNKYCELCKSPATTYCESDRATLCCDCDSKVHGANFLVSRHVRGLLCRTCQSLTPWRASGSNLGHSTVSLCDTCSQNTEPNKSRKRGEQEISEEEEGQIQVVPFASESATPPAPSDSTPSSSSSSSSSFSSCSPSGDAGGVSLKRLRDTSSSNLLFLPQDEVHHHPRVKEGQQVKQVVRRKKKRLTSR